MNMNMSLSLKFDLPAIIAFGKRFGPTFIGLLLVGVFGYTGWVINAAFNVKPDEATAAAPVAHIVFDQKTIDTVKSLRVVPGAVPTGTLGKADPFGN